MADACQNYGQRSHYVSAMHFTRNPSLSPNVRHVSAPAAQAKRSGVPPRRSARWETSLGLPAAVAPFALAAAAIQFSLPVDWTGLCDRRKRQQHYCSQYLLHVQRYPIEPNAGAPVWQTYRERS
jgi:hypothetical protein